MEIPLIDERVTANLLKNDVFRQHYKNLMRDLLKSIDFSDYDDYGYEFFPSNNKWGVYTIYNGKKLWSWMNVINTNYSCLYIMTNRVNFTIKDYLKNEIPYIDFINTTDIIGELNGLFDVLNRFKQEFFTPKNKHKKHNLFNAMRFQTMKTWYVGKLQEIYFLENLDCFFTNVIGHTLDFDRGDKSDMDYGNDFAIITNDGTYKFQHKNGTLFKIIDDYYYFMTIIYDKKHFEGIDYISITTNISNMYVFRFNSELCEMIEHTNNIRYFRIHKSLLLPKLKEVKMTLTDNLRNLLDFCAKNKINFYIETNEHSVNSIEYTNTIEPNVHIIFNNPDDISFAKKINNILETLKINYNL